MTFGLDEDLALSDPSRPSSIIASGTRMSVNSTIVVEKNAPLARRLAYALGGLEFGLVSRSGAPNQFQLKATPMISSSTDFAFIRNLGRAWPLPGPIKSHAFPDQARTYYQNAGFLSDLEAAYEAALDAVFYLGPLREFPKRDYLWARSRPSDVGQRGERAIDAILAATEAGEKRNLRPRARLLPFQQMIASLLRDMGMVESFTVEEIALGSNRWQARVRTRPDASEVLLTDVGFGVSQVLPVVTLLQYVPEGATVILEQPEIHLHPLAQAGLADVIIQAATHRRVQVILESHSEHLLLRLQRRTAEQMISSDDVKLYFCDSPGGFSTLTPLEVDLLGRILNWPDKFMGDAFTETAQAERARLERMNAAE